MKINNRQNNRQYSICGGLTDSDMDRMHQGMLDLIENLGLKVPHKGILDIISGKDGVKIEGDIVKFKPYLVEKAISEMEYPDYVHKANYIINGGAYELNVLDIDTNKIRPALSSDLPDLVKLVDSFGMYASSPIRPTDIKSLELQEIIMYKVCWENSPRVSNSIFEANEKSTFRAAEYIYEMSKIANKRFSLSFWIKSPFKVDFKELDIIYKFLDRKVPLWVATMPIAGATAPIYFPGAYVQSMAEVFSGLTLLNLINTSDIKPVCLIIDTIRAYTFDFKYASFIYGSPEDILGTLFQIQLNKKYGIPVVAKSLLTSSIDIDSQLGVEVMAHTMTAALAGARIFTGAGLLAIDEVYSAEKLVLDNEVVNYVKSLVKGFNFSDESLSLDIIKDVGIGGEFISHQSTISDFRNAIWQPEVFEHIMYSTRRKQGEPKLRDKLKRIAKDRIRKHEYELPEDIKKELDKIFKKALIEFGG